MEDESSTTTTAETIANESDAASAMSATSSLRTSEFTLSKTPPLQSLNQTVRKSSFWKYLVLGIYLTNIKMIWRHMDATMPKYMLRKFGADVPFGSILAIDPLSIVLATPLITFLAENIESLPKLI